MQTEPTTQQPILQAVPLNKRLMSKTVYIVEYASKYSQDGIGTETYTDFDRVLSHHFDEADDGTVTPDADVIGIYEIRSGQMKPLDKYELAAEETQERADARAEQNYHYSQPYR